MMSNVKRIMAAVVMITMLAAGIAIVPKTVKADENMTLPTTVDYDNTFKIAEYWRTDTKTVPVKDGYVFGGWYTKSGDTYSPIKEADLVNEGIETYADAYAKFVPAYVLSVRMQLEKGTETKNGVDVASTYLRVISAVDSLDYQNVGFDLLFGKKTPLSESENAKTVLSKVYKNIDNDDGSMNATTVFGAPATHFSILKVNTIKANNYEKVIYVTPYWTTMDGTKVEGLSKYVRVMDGYAKNQYISIPVNLLSGDAVAAGQLQMTYDSNKLKYVGFDAGVLLPEMDVNAVESKGIIRFVGNGTIDNNGDKVDVAPESDIYANVWFQKKTETSEHWNFTMDGISFCNWAEKTIDNVVARNVRY